MMRTNVLKIGARRSVALRFLSRVAELSMQEEIKEPAAAEDTGSSTDEAVDTAHHHPCVFCDMLVSTNIDEYQTIVELVSWTSKEAYTIQKLFFSVQEKYSGMTRVAIERHTTSFWERNDELSTETL
jgi:hypothetical protein